MSLFPYEETFICPYDSSHIILMQRAGKHLKKCRDNHPKSRIAICKYDTLHHVPAADLVSHQQECLKRLETLNRQEVDENWTQTLEAPNPTQNASAVFTSEAHDDWAEECPKYDPEKAAKEKNVLRLKQNCSRSEKIEHKYEEKRRLQSFDNNPSKPAAKYSKKKPKSKSGAQKSQTK